MKRRQIRRYQRRRIAAACFLVLLLPCSILAQDSSTSTAEGKKAEQRGVRFTYKDRPSLRIGKSVRIDFRAKFHGDFRGFPLEDKKKTTLFEFRRARVGVQGNFLREFEYELETELTDDQPRLRDAYLNLRYFRDFQIQVGKFKQPFGRDRLTAFHNLDFIFRSRIGSEIAPGRDIGVMVHGRFYNRGLNYQTGIFRGSGEDDASGRTIVARLTGLPLRLVPTPEWLRSLELGIAVASSRLPEGTIAPRGETVFGQAFSQRVQVNGRRFRAGIEMEWASGPFSIQGEFIHSRDGRRQQSVRMEDLPDAIARGWYLGATWAITGEKKAEGIHPRKEFLRNGGFGALEVATRYEHLRFASSEHPGPPVAHARAPNIPSTSDRAWTAGINWYLNRYIRIQGNVIRERVEGFPLDSSADRQIFWSRIARLQFVM